MSLVDQFRIFSQGQLENWQSPKRLDTLGVRTMQNWSRKKSHLVKFCCHPVYCPNCVSKTPHYLLYHKFSILLEESGATLHLNKVSMLFEPPGIEICTFDHIKPVIGFL